MVDEAPSGMPRTLTSLNVAGSCGHHFPQPVQYCPYCGKPQIENGESAAQGGVVLSSVAGQETVSTANGSSPAPEREAEILERRAQVDTELSDKSDRLGGRIARGERPKRRSRRILLFGLVSAGLVFGALIMVQHNATVPVPAPRPLPLPAEPARTRATPNTASPLPAGGLGSADKTKPSFEVPFEKPSFCANATYADEVKICQSRPLSIIELGMETAYSALRNRQSGRHVPADVRNYARAMLAKRHQCRDDAACIDVILLAEKAYFTNYGN